MTDRLQRAEKSRIALDASYMKNFLCRINRTNAVRSLLSSPFDRFVAFDAYAFLFIHNPFSISGG
jgi:hypothetical protein